MTTRCVAITDTTAVVDGNAFEHVDTGIFDGLGIFVDRVAKSGAGSVLLAEGAQARLGLPAELPAELPADAPGLQDARRAGWRVADLTATGWLTFWQPASQRALHLTALDWLSPAHFPLWVPGSLEKTTARCARFHELIGAPYHGRTAGLAGISALRLFARGPKRGEPNWRPQNWDTIPAARECAEQASTWVNWSRCDGAEWELGYDANTQYLSAAGVANFALSQLRSVPVDQAMTAAERGAAMPGYYLVEVDPWPWTADIPHPMGVDASQIGQQVWITAPTLDLLLRMSTDTPVFHYPRVVECWAAPGARIMRTWYERIRDAIEAAREDEDPVMLATVKDTYKAARGLLVRPTSRIHRPDWSHTIVAQARCNLWRKVWAEGGNQWPTAITEDTVWYPAATDNHLAHWPKNFPDHPGSGGFKAYGAHNTRDPQKCWTESGVRCVRCLLNDRERSA